MFPFHYTTFNYPRFQFVTWNVRFIYRKCCHLTKFVRTVMKRTNIIENIIYNICSRFGRHSFCTLYNKTKRSKWVIIWHVAYMVSIKFQHLHRPSIFLPAFPPQVSLILFPGKVWNNGAVLTVFTKRAETRNGHLEGNDFMMGLTLLLK